MKTRFLSTAITAAALFLTACSTEENPGEAWDGRIHLSSGVATLTRATHNLDEKIANNEKVWIYIDGSATGADAVQYYGKQLTANGGNGFSDADNLFFPANETSINLYAFHINEPSTASISASAYPTVQLTHQVSQDQRSSGNGYAKSDLLYAKTSLTKENAKSNGGAVELPFKHQLSKIEVVLKKDASVGDATIDNVEILNTMLQGTFTPSKTSESISVMASGSIDGSNPIQIDNDLTTNDTPVLNEAIIIPQIINEGTAFICVTLSTGGVLVYKLGDTDPSTTSVTFDAGTKYRYTITAKLTGLQVTSSIAPWSGDSSVSGDATMD